MQYTSMNTLVYADVSASQTSAASTIAATGQQLAISFGVAGAALVAAIFVPPELHSHPAAIVHGVQQAFLALGALTILSSVVFMELKADDGARHEQPRRRAPPPRRALRPSGLRRQIAMVSTVAKATQARYGTISSPAQRSMGRKASVVTTTPTSSTKMVATAAPIFCRPKNTTVQPSVSASCRANSVSGPRLVSRSAARHTRQAAIAIST